MPTGYTAAIYDGMSFEDFVLNCAGALISHEFVPNDYYAKRLVVLHEDLKQMQAMLLEQADLIARREFDEKETSRFGYRQNQQEARTQYESMLKRVHAWTPPTPGHQELKVFMIQQIEESIKFDCADYSYEPLVLLSGEEWKAARIAAILKHIHYYEQKNLDEIKLTRERSEWVSALRSSLHK